MEYIDGLKKNYTSVWFGQNEQAYLPEEMKNGYID